MIRQIEKILFTSDLTKGSVEVFEQTVALASQMGASISILHVMQEPSSGTETKMVHIIDSQVYEKILKDRQEKIKNALVGKKRGVPLILNALRELCEKTTNKICRDQPVNIDRIDVMYGNPADEITRFSESESCDLIVMGYKKKGSLLKALTGNIAKKVIAQSHKPVFLVLLE